GDPGQAGDIPSPGHRQPEQRRLLRGPDLAAAYQGQADPSCDGNGCGRREHRGRATVQGAVSPAYPRTSPRRRTAAGAVYSGSHGPSYPLPILLNTSPTSPLFRKRTNGSRVESCCHSYSVDSVICCAISLP